MEIELQNLGTVIATVSYTQHLEKFVAHMAAGDELAALHAASAACHAAPRLREPHYAYGQAWLAQWKRSGGSVDSLILSWDGGGNEWPWPYHVDQSVRVGADTLELEMHVTNRSDFPAPLDLGWHPYFPAASQATLRARTEHVWLTDSEHLPTRIAPVPEGWKFDHPRTLVAAGIDNSFVGWDGAAELTWPHHSISMQSVGCTHLHVFAPTPDDSVCIEPQTAAPTALNRGGLDVHVAAPGERISISTRFKVVHAL